jgi:hypothetical protein
MEKKRPTITRYLAITTQHLEITIALALIIPGIQVNKEEPCAKQLKFKNCYLNWHWQWRWRET